MIISQFERLVASAAQNNKCRAWNAWRRRNPKKEIDLSHADLSGLELKGANLDDANLRSANLSASNLFRASLRYANLGSGEIVGWLRGMKDPSELWEFEEREGWWNATEDPEHGVTDLRNAYFEEADLTGVKIDAAEMRYANFENANLLHATVSLTNAAETNFRNARLTGASFRYSLLRNADFNGAHVHGIDDIHGTSFVCVNLSGVALSDVVGLTDATFHRVKMAKKAQAVLLAAIAESLVDAD